MAKKTQKHLRRPLTIKIANGGRSFKRGDIITLATSRRKHPVTLRVKSVLDARL